VLQELLLEVGDLRRVHLVQKSCKERKVSILSINFNFFGGQCYKNCGRFLCLREKFKPNACSVGAMFLPIPFLKTLPSGTCALWGVYTTRNLVLNLTALDFVVRQILCRPTKF
jgi:hypothetical protein